MIVNPSRECLMQVWKAFMHAFWHRKEHPFTEVEFMANNTLYVVKNRTHYKVFPGFKA
jgi:hypothetical protein